WKSGITQGGQFHRLVGQQSQADGVVGAEHRGRADRGPRIVEAQLQACGKRQRRRGAGRNHAFLLAANVVVSAQSARSKSPAGKNPAFCPPPKGSPPSTPLKAPQATLSQ